MVARAQTRGLHGEALAAVLDVGPALALGDTAMVIQGIGDGEIPLRRDGEAQSDLAVVELVVARQAAHVDAVAHRRLLLLELDLDPLQVAAGFQVDGVLAVDGVELTIGPLLACADLGLLGIDLACQGVGPVVLLALLGAGYGQHCLQVGTLAAGIEYPGLGLVTCRKIDGGVDGPALAPGQRRLGAAVEAGVDQVVEAVGGITHLPDPEDDLVTGACRQGALMGDLLGGLHHVAVDHAERVEIEGVTGQGLVRVPILLGEVVAPVAGHVVGGEGPADGEGTGLHIALGPAIAGLGIELSELRVPGRGDLAVGGAAIGEAGRRLQALGLPLNGATLAVAAGLAQIVAPFRLADVTVGEHAAAGQQRQRRGHMIELNFCCHTFLCSVMWAVKLAGEFPVTHLGVATPLSWTTCL
ncbi:hypothetical protein D3C85_1016150 [compost metagenome]